MEKVAFNPIKDAELASLGSDGVVKFWDVRARASVNEVKGLGTAHSMAWDPDGTSVLVSSKVRPPLNPLSHLASTDTTHRAAIFLAYPQRSRQYYPPTNNQATSSRWPFPGMGREYTAP